MKPRVTEPAIFYLDSYGEPQTNFHASGAKKKKTADRNGNITAIKQIIKTVKCHIQTDVEKSQSNHNNQIQSREQLSRCQSRFGDNVQVQQLGTPKVLTRTKPVD